MTTKNSPAARLKQQADRMAAHLKKLERGEEPDPTGKLKLARAKEEISFAIAMDDQTIIVDMAWSVIRDTDEAGIAVWILNQMQGRKPS